VAIPKLTPLMGFWQLQLFLLGVALAISGMFWLLLGNTNPTPQFLFAFIIGNCTWLAVTVSAPLLLKQQSPWDWFAYLAVLLPVAAVASSMASVASRIVAGRTDHLLQLDWSDIRNGTFFSLVAGVALFILGKAKGRLERRNRELERQITVGRVELEAHEAELKAAHEIRAHLLPHELPQMQPFQIACAWEPARSVGGDYFDVLTLGPDQLGICITDVSGKGITAVLLMANLQAAVRAFAPASSGPGALCVKLNEVLCGSIAPRKFVTLFYGTIDRQRLILHFLRTPGTLRRLYCGGTRRPFSPKAAQYWGCSRNPFMRSGSSLCARAIACCSRRTE
jgi:sigma-B regulation protein RsbU (phosphoserine phosphatase)